MSSLDNDHLRTLAPKELALHLRQAVLQQNNVAYIRDLTAHLLDAVQTGALIPRAFNIWLSVAHSTVTIAAALRQDFSRSIRRYAIVRLGELLRKQTWEVTLEALGGSETILELFQGFSIEHVRLLTQRLAKATSANKSDQNQKKQALVTNIFFTLNSPQHGDKRPLGHTYRGLMPACSTHFIKDQLTKELVDNQGRSQIELLIQQYPEIFQRLVIGAIEGKNDLKDLKTYLVPLLRRYPTASGTVLGFSASMEFSLRVLQIVANNKDAVLPHGLVIQELAIPLIRRAFDRNVDMSRISEILRLVVIYLQTHPNDARSLSLSRGGLLWQLIVRREFVWRVKHHDWPGPLGTALLDLLDLLPKKKDTSISVLGEVISCIPTEIGRQRILRLLLLHTTVTSLDIDKDEDMKALSELWWPCSVFFQMSPEQGLYLYQGLLRASPGKEFLTREHCGHTILKIGPEPYFERVDTNLLLCLLKQRLPQAGQTHEPSIIDERKSKAAGSRDQYERAFWAESALFHAIATGSVDTYRDTLLWTRRFIRDPRTIVTLYGSGTLHTQQGINLLSGVPDRVDKYDNRLATSDMAHVIKTANLALEEMFDTAVLAIREPSFQWYAWRPVFEVFALVCQARMDRALSLWGGSQMSTDELVQLLWDDTLDMLVRVERKALQPGNAQLKFRLRNGMLGSIPSSSGKAADSTLVFLDKLAQVRDQLWKEVRPLSYPESTTLPPPWPRGLPLQKLAPNLIDWTTAAADRVPFIAQRAKSIVYMPEVVALAPIASVADWKESIDGFVEDYRTALELYVQQPRDGEVEQPNQYSFDNDAPIAKRAAAAWDHALSQLTGARMTKEEATRFWTPVFQRALPGLVTSEKRPRETPCLPRTTDPFQSEEWDPMSGAPLGVDARFLPVTIIDSMVFASLHNVEARVPAIVPEHIWSTDQLDVRRSPIAVVEGLIASTLLFLDSKKGGSRRVLKTAFPSATDVRYPALYLDSDFLLRKPLRTDRALQVLEHLRFFLPKRLVVELAGGILENLLLIPADFSEQHQMERMAIGLTKILADGDQPDLASGLILQMIDRPDASSWHRQLVTKGYLRRLTPKQSQAFFDSLVTSLVNKVNGKTSSDGRYTKVTTFKMIAQLLDDADFISPSFAVDILSQLFTTSKQRDVRIEVGNSLLARLSRCTSNDTELVDRIINQLTEIVPIAASLDENKPTLTEAGWAEAERTMSLPEVDARLSLSPQPMMTMLLDAASNDALPSSIRQRIMNELLLPAVEASCENNDRWQTLFVKKYHALGLEPVDLPLVPVCARTLVEMIERLMDMIPSWILDRYHAWVKEIMSTKSPTSKARQLRATDPELSQSCEGRFWLIHLNDESARADCRILTSYLRLKWHGSKRDDGVQISQIQDVVVEQAQMLLRLNDPFFDRWQRLVSTLDPFLAGTDLEAWNKHGKPVLQRIIDHAHALRTSSWQQDPHRQPTVLPDMFAEKLRLLFHPMLLPDSTDDTLHRERCEDFGRQARDVLDRMVGMSGGVYHRKFADLTQYILKRRVGWKVRVRIARGIASTIDVDKDVLLMVDLLAGVLTEVVLTDLDVSELDDQEVGRTTELLLAWAESRHEELRMTAFRLGAKLTKPT